MKPPPKPRRVVADTRRQRALDAILVDHDFPTAAGVIATLPAWMRPYFRAWDNSGFVAHNPATSCPQSGLQPEQCWCCTTR